MRGFGRDTAVVSLQGPQTETTSDLATGVKIRPAVKEDIEAITRLRKQALAESSPHDISHDQLIHEVAVLSQDRILEHIRDECVLVAEAGGSLVACNCLDLERGEMEGLVVDQEFRGLGLGVRLVTGIERLAIQYGMWELRTEAPRPRIGFFEHCRYEPVSGAELHTDHQTRLLSLPMQRRFPQRQTRYGAQIRGLLEQLGISSHYGRERRLKLQAECHELATIGEDVFGREQMMLPEAAMAWYAMRNAAESDGIDLQIASAFRTVDYQFGIVKRKKESGQSMNEILSVTAAPGYSEHHTGRAIDITTPGSKALEEDFESTEAFEWLTESADQFGFTMSYPRNNRHGLMYEPWHWAWRG